MTPPNDRRELDRQLNHQARRTLTDLAARVELLLTDTAMPLTDEQGTELEAVYALAEQALIDVTLITNALTRLAETALDDTAHREWAQPLLDKLGHKGSK